MDDVYKHVVDRLATETCDDDVLLTVFVPCKSYYKIANEILSAEKRRLSKMNNKADGVAAVDEALAVLKLATVGNSGLVIFSGRSSEPNSKCVSAIGMEPTVSPDTFKFVMDTRYHVFEGLKITTAGSYTPRHIWYRQRS